MVKRNRIVASTILIIGVIVLSLQTNTLRNQENNSFTNELHYMNAELTNNWQSNIFTFANFRTGYNFEYQSTSNHLSTCCFEIPGLVIPDLIQSVIHENHGKEITHSKRSTTICGHCIPNVYQSKLVKKRIDRHSSQLNNSHLNTVL